MIQHVPRGWAGLAAPATRYLAVMLAMNLVWEVAQLPLYTLWAEATPGEIAFATYNAPADLRGQRIGLGAIGSTSRHLGPLQVMADHGVDPRTELRPVHLSTGVLLEALARGDLPAIGVNATDLQRLRERHPTLALRVIGRGRDLPMDLILAGPHVDAALVERLREAFRRHGAELSRAIIEAGGENAKFSGMHWVPTIRDEDYSYVRRMYGTIGQTQFSEFVGD